MRRPKISDRQGVSAKKWADALNMVVGYSILVAPVAAFVCAVRHFYPPDWPYLPAAISVFPVLGLSICLSQAYTTRYAASLSGYFWHWIVLAVCIWFLHGGIMTIAAAYHHSGGGYVGVYERNSRGESEWVDDVWVDDEYQYKRNQYVNGTLVALVGAIGLYYTIVVYIRDMRKAGPVA